MLDINNQLKNRTFFVRAFGCQMNISDSERIKGLLEYYGAIEVATPDEAEIIIFLTCCVREAADIRLLGQAASLKTKQKLIAIGGCIGQRDGEKLIKELPHVQIVFGTHNLHNLATLIIKYYETKKSQVERFDDSVGYIQETEPKQENPWRAWIPIMTGCNNFCSYCIVPYVRGREKSRPVEDLKNSIDYYASLGVKEAILLGQNVNSYGRDLYGDTRFSEILKYAAKSGIERIRFVTSHPKDLLPQTIETIGSYDSIMPQLHLPLQSGSNKLLHEMNRKYTVEHYLSLVDELRLAKPDISLSTDIIVGYPNENAEDFQATYDVVKQVGYGQVFTFIYSRRQGTKAATIPDLNSKELIQERFESLVDLVQKSAYQQNLNELDCNIGVLVENSSKRNKQMLSGKSPKNQTVHALIPNHHTIDDYKGKIVQVHINKTKTWYLQGTLLE